MNLNSQDRLLINGVPYKVAGIDNAIVMVSNFGKAFEINNCSVTIGSGLASFQTNDVVKINGIKYNVECGCSSDTVSLKPCLKKIKNKKLKKIELNKSPWAQGVYAKKEAKLLRRMYH